MTKSQEENDEVSLTGLKNKEQKPRVQSALRTVSILLAIAERNDGLQIKEIVEKLGLSRQVTYHLIHTLYATGIIRKNTYRNNRYVLGLAAGSIADGFHRQLAPRTSCSQGARHSGKDRRDGLRGWLGAQRNRSAGRPGRPLAGVSDGSSEGYRGHAHARASGNPAVREAYLAEHPLERRTGKTITERQRLEQEFEIIRACGYSIDDEGFTKDFVVWRCR